MSSEARVGVIVPLYNLRPFVGEAIESVLTQTLPPDEIEVVVVDDGSTDGGGDVVRAFGSRVRYLRQDNRGLSAARNAGIRASRAPFLAFLDADDRFLPDKLAAQLTLLTARPDVTVAYTGVRYIDERGARLPRHGWSRAEGDILPQLVLGNVIHPLAALVRREPVVRAGGFDERLTSLEDWDLWLRLSRRGARWACIDEALAEYRIRPGGMHQNAARMVENAVTVLDGFFGDPSLAAEIARLAPLAYQNAYLIAASDHFRGGDAEAGRRWFRAAVTVRPALLTEPRTLRRFCRWLLPLEQQSEEAVAVDRRRLTSILRQALDDVFAAPDLDQVVARLRRRARLAYWRTAMRLARKQLRWPAVGGTPRSFGSTIRH